MYSAMQHERISMKPGLLYRFLKWYVPVGFRFFYRKVHIRGLENIPADSPLIFAINHQNAFMDAIVVASTTPRNPWFITRASVFRSSVARYWLQKLQMLPIYRFRDGHAEMKKNDEAMEAVQKLLQQQEAILIFPEGNHNRNWALRPLQKGIARMAFSLEQQKNFRSGLMIVPVGLQYENHLRSGSEFLISYGKPIATADYHQLFEEQPAKAINALLHDLKESMLPLILHIEPTEKYDAIKSAVQNRTGRERNLTDRLFTDQQFIQALEKQELPAIQESNPLPKNKSCTWQWPLYFLSMLLHYPALYLTRFVVKKTVKDDHWTSSIKFAVLLFGAPIVYLLQALIGLLLGLSWPWLLAYAIALPLTGKLFVNLRGRCKK